jgi:hypothetical protein
MCLFIQLLTPRLTPVSLLESELGFEIDTQIPDTAQEYQSKVPNSRIYRPYACNMLNIQTEIYYSYVEL